MPRTQIFLIKFGNTLHSSITPKTLIIQSHLYKKSLNFNEIIVLLKGACLNSSRFWLPSQSLIFMTYRYKLLQNPNGSILPPFRRISTEKQLPKNLQDNHRRDQICNPLQGTPTFRDGLQSLAESIPLPPLIFPPPEAFLKNLHHFHRLLREICLRP